MKYIKKYNQFNESIGVAEPTLIYSKYILKNTEFYLNKFIDSGKSKLKENKYYELSNRKDIIMDELWNKYPVIKMNIIYDFEKMKDDSFNKKYPTTSKIKGYITLGSCFTIEENKLKNSSYLLPPIDKRTKHTIFLKLLVGGVIRENFNEKEELLLEIESAILHELNHAYESYMRLLKGYGNMSLDLTSSTDVNRSKVKKEVFKIWNDKLCYYLYTSERHELNAETQEALPYVKKYDVDEMKKFCPSWRIANEMSKFNISDFRKEITKVINKNYSEVDTDFILTKLKNGFANELINNRKDSIERSDDIPSLDGNKIYNMNINEFLKYVEKRVNKAGEKLKRKIYRLYSIKKQE